MHFDNPLTGARHVWYNRLMNDDQLDDLKQFITATVSQATADMATKDDIAALSNKIDDLELKVDTISETLNDHLNQHEVRLNKLEQQTV
jgi:hypothetical protein